MPPGKTSAGQMSFNQEETALVESPRPEGEKSDIPLTMIDS